MSENDWFLNFSNLVKAVCDRRNNLNNRKYLCQHGRGSGGFPARLNQSAKPAGSVWWSLGVVCCVCWRCRDPFHWINIITKVTIRKAASGKSVWCSKGTTCVAFCHWKKGTRGYTENESAAPSVLPSPPLVSFFDRVTQYYMSFFLISS